VHSIKSVLKFHIGHIGQSSLYLDISRILVGYSEAKQLTIWNRTHHCEVSRRNWKHALVLSRFFYWHYNSL